MASWPSVLLVLHKLTLEASVLKVSQLSWLYAKLGWAAGSSGRDNDLD